MSTVAEIKAAIDQLSSREQDEVKVYLRQRIVEDHQESAERQPDGNIDPNPVGT